MDGVEAETGRSGLSRRDLIKRSAVAGAVAWSAPMIIDSLTSPAAALTCPSGGRAYVLLYSPSGTTNNTDPVRDRPADYNAGFSSGGCDLQAPNCAPSNLPAVWTTMAAVDMTVTGPRLIHQIASISQGAVTITLAPTSCCTISNVKAHVHRYGAATNPDCPNPYCQTATSGGTYFQLTGGAYGTKTVTVRPSTSVVCSGGQQVHWGSPNTDSGCGTTGSQTSGQPLGYMIVELQC